MIVSHRAPSSLNMTPYRAIWIHFRPSSMIFINLNTLQMAGIWDRFTTDSRQVHDRCTIIRFAIGSRQVHDRFTTDSELQIAGIMDAQTSGRQKTTLGHLSTRRRRAHCTGMANWPNTIQCLGSDDIMSLGIMSSAFLRVLVLKTFQEFDPSFLDMS